MTPASESTDPPTRQFWARFGSPLLAALAVALALYGQSRIAPDRLSVATRYYAAAIIIWLVATHDSSGKRRPFSPVPSRSASMENHRVKSIFLWVALSLALSLTGAIQLHLGQYSSTAGGLLWLASLAVLLLAFRRQSSNPPSRTVRLETHTTQENGFRPRIVRTLPFLAILLLALAFRFHRLDDWTTGMHGDEGEVGIQALQILGGNTVSPFRTGWAGENNVYFWGIALCMKLAGHGLAGLRLFSAICGSLILLPFYALVRALFGFRCALLAGFLLAVSDVAVHFSRVGLSNITVPLLLVTGLFFLVRGLYLSRPTSIILAGYAHAASLYFYQGGRLTPIIGVAFCLYLSLGVTVARLRRRPRSPVPGENGEFPETPRSRLVRSIAIYAIAAVCFASPRIAYDVDHWIETSSRTKDKLVFNNPDRMAAQHGIQHVPLYFGVHLPLPADAMPLPVAFETTPSGIKLCSDGFWPRILWAQVSATLSVLTYRPDASGFYTFTDEPVVKPTEAALIVLGIAWSLWRFRDPRFALLSLWFWLTVLVGGTLTIDTPYMPRLVGLLPVLPLFAAIVLDQLARRFEGISGPGRYERLVKAFTSIGLAGLLVFLAWRNYVDYFHRYTRSPLAFSAGMGQSVFVREMNRRVASEGRARPRYFNLGAHEIYWGHGVNGFLNPDTQGGDMLNPANELPLTDPGGCDVVFIIWENNRHYLAMLEAFYPEGTEEPFFYGPPKQQGLLFTSYRIKREALDSLRASRAIYVSAVGQHSSRDEAGFGTIDEPPVDLVYPVTARWVGNLFAPEFSLYRFQVLSSAETSLVVDGLKLSDHRAGGGLLEEVSMARGLHAVELSAELPSREARVEILWSRAGSEPARVPRRFLWLGHGRSLLAEIRAVSKVSGSLAALDHDGGWNRLPLISRRVDSFLGFRGSADVLSGGIPLVASWRGRLHVRYGGQYQFEVHSNGPSLLRIDGATVIDNREAALIGQAALGAVDLSEGRHVFELLYSSEGPFGMLEVFWKPPDGPRRLLGPGDLETDGGAWLPGESGHRDP